MHEFAIIQNIIDIAAKTAKENNISHVSAVEVEVGKAAGVIREAMEFAWEAAIKETILRDAILKITEKSLVVKCMICQQQYEPCDIYEPCPGCGEINPEVISGKELRVVAIETM
jgi:hydrogenase nickel incorporation protein HypA/HybF